MDGCQFCAIARGENDSVEFVAASDLWVAFFPDCPATEGHTLLIPQHHVPDILGLDRITAHALSDATLLLARALNLALGPEGMNIIVSSGEAAEQTVFHLHTHLVPRWSDDRMGPIWPDKRPMAKAEKQTLAKRITAALDKVVAMEATAAVALEKP